MNFIPVTKRRLQLLEMLCNFHLAESRNEAAMSDTRDFQELLGQLNFEKENMQPHIKQTIEHIELKILFLQRLAEALRNFGGVTDLAGQTARSTAAAPRTGKPRKPKAQNGDSFKRVPPPRTGPGEVTVVDAFRQIMSGWAGEFTAKMISEAAVKKFPAIEKKVENGSSVALGFLARAGEVEKIGQGKATKWKRIIRQSVNDLHRQIRSEVDAKKAEE